MLKVVEMAFDAIIHTTIYKRILAKIKYCLVFFAKIGCFLSQLLLESLNLTNLFKSNSEFSGFFILFYLQNRVLHIPKQRHYPLHPAPVSTIS